MKQCNLSIFVFTDEPIAYADNGGVVRTHVEKTKNEVDVLVDSSVEIGRTVSCLGNFVEFHIQNRASDGLNTDVTNAFDLMVRAAKSRTKLPPLKDNVQNKKITALK